MRPCPNRPPSQARSPPAISRRSRPTTITKPTEGPVGLSPCHPQPAASLGHVCACVLATPLGMGEPCISLLACRGNHAAPWRVSRWPAPRPPAGTRTWCRLSLDEHTREILRDRQQTHTLQRFVRSGPFAASPTLHYGSSTACTRCPEAPPETAEHALLDCPAYSHLRAQARFAPLFAAPLPAGARLRVFARSPDQFALAESVHACFEDRHNAQETWQSSHSTPNELG